MKRFESFGLDTSNECLWRDSVQIALPPKPFKVLRYLVENPGRLITHDELLDALWPETYVQPQVLRTYVLELRKVLGDDAGRPRFIQTLPKRGYCFVAPVVDAAGLAGSRVSATWTQAGAATGIVDRAGDLARLETLAQLAASGQRQVVFVTGGAGMGKTALVDAFCRQMSASMPASVVCGQGVEGLGKKGDYYPVMEALSQLCASEAGERVSRILARMAPAWLPALGRERAAPNVTEAWSAAERAPGDLCGALEGMAQEQPLIFVFEDLQWADDSTLELISALARRRARAALMVLATFRHLDGSTEHPLRALKQDLLTHRLCAEIVLAPLAMTAVRQLLRRELGQDSLPAGLDDFVYRHSEGIPLFALALLEHLVAQRFLVRTGTEDGARWSSVRLFRRWKPVCPTNWRD